MLLFLDTEFTDFIDIDLISIGLVSEDGHHVFYAERNDYRIESASDFVRVAVLPQLGRLPNAICSREGLTLRLYDWFRTLPEQVKIACDSAHDRDLLWDALEDGLPSNLDPRMVELAWLSEDPQFNAAVETYYLGSGLLRHHALHDASALRAGWLGQKR